MFFHQVFIIILENSISFNLFYLIELLLLCIWFLYIFYTPWYIIFIYILNIQLDLPISVWFQLFLISSSFTKKIHFFCLLQMSLHFTFISETFSLSIEF